MKISLAAIGKLGQGAENQLAKAYVSRAALCGKAMGFGQCELIEIDVKKAHMGDKGQEAQALRQALNDQVTIICCDERGAQLTSRQLASLLEKYKDQGTKHLAFVIGGADGLDAEFVATAQKTIAFGPQTWPHALVRIMLAEQIYRSLTILAGHPYHRD